MIMTDRIMSPTTQVVWNAFLDHCEWEVTTSELKGIAAALRAAVKECQIEWNYHPDYPETESVVVASDLLAIATELENLQ